MKKRIVSFLLTVFCMPISSVWAEIPTEDMQVETEKVVYKSSIPKEKAESVEKLQIHWVRGTVTIIASEDETIHMTQTSAQQPRKKADLVGYTIKDGVLLVEDNNPLPEFSMYMEEELQQLFEEYGIISYDLTIALPQKAYRELYFTTKQGSCVVTEGSFQDVIGETATGTLRFSNMTSQSIQGKAIEGNIVITADTTAGQYDVQSTNGTVDVAVSSLPEKFAVGVVNGHMTVTLPENDGFFIEKANFHTYKGFSTSFYLKDANGKKTYKKGGYPLELSCRNGTVTLLRLTE